MKFLYFLLFILITYRIKCSHLKGVNPRELMVNDHQDKVKDKEGF